jgi:excisionase family DNA binding protein
MVEPARLYTPKTLAERWGCSEAHIKGMARRCYLATFRLGGKLLRISADEVERWERGATAEAARGSK